MRTIVMISIIITCFWSCEKVNTDLNNRIELNYSLNCLDDSSYFYYGANDAIINLSLSYRTITLSFSDSVQTDYFNKLLSKNQELDSISYFYPQDFIAFGYLKGNLSCEEILNLLTNLNYEEKVLAVNPNFILIDGGGAEIGLSNRFIVKLKDTTPVAVLDSLLELTNTKLIEHKKLYTIISADKYSNSNSLETSNYFFETGFFQYSHPSWCIKAVPYYDL